MTLRAGDAALMNKSIGSDFSAHQSNSNESSPVETGDRNAGSVRCLLE